ncbi:M48 family metalloprotease [Aurantiacibacter sediminis]|uniref:M48 family metalloprotease n=1 Tax=Aurantiacibacter sediminis TaxID=2793064 RepID=A0ABS0N4Q2_9SPHN|nr:M48 family metalloprotease [Aurantiacibacter sediminis]MBH5322571.1 M48 family metalloprotease [Aurantiacibacter sediminis]
MTRYLFAFAITALLAVAAPASLQAQEQSDWEMLQAQDLRLARIADRIMTANARLCRAQMPITGMILHSADQYSDGAEVGTRFANGPLAIAGILPNSPAAEAGLQTNDAIMTINGTRIADLPPPEIGNLREAGFDLLARQDPSSPLNLRIVRGGASEDMIVQPVAGCRSLVEIRLGDGPRARSDGRVIQVRYDLALQMSDDEMAAVFAHELAHTVLEHRRRKEEAGISVGALGEFGRNQQANREAEVEADRLSVHLLSNAGYDPAISPVLWRTGIGGRLSGGIMGSWIYPSAGARADLIEREIVMYLPNRRGPSWPGHLLALRDRNFSRD